MTVVFFGIGTLYRYLPVASWTVVWLSVVPRYDGRVRGALVAARPADLLAADLAVDLVVRPDGHDADVHRALAVVAAQALLVVHAALDVHLFRL